MLTISSNNRPIVIWLLCGCFLIFCMVFIGGITRLTGSGLSITEWKPIMGAIPPMNAAQWQEAFEKYQQIPQFQKVNYDFNIDDFKSIFWWEYLHRLLGRLIGVVFIVPFLWFYFKKMLDKDIIRKALFLFLLGGLQGTIGWLMVATGLQDRTSVSHIALAIHLITAFITFGFTLYFALELVFERKVYRSNKNLRKLIRALFIVVIVQVVYGAFVAGMHAGKIYNTFPLMNGSIIPDGIMNISPWWKNIFNNQITVQWIHRFFAGVIFIMTIMIGLKRNAETLKPVQKKGIILLVSAAFIQIVLGIFTILTEVDSTMALLHQAGAFLLFSACVFLVYHFPKRKVV